MKRYGMAVDEINGDTAVNGVQKSFSPFYAMVHNSVCEVSEMTSLLMISLRSMRL